MLNTLPAEFKTTLVGEDGPKEYVLLAGLLKLAHDNGLQRVQSKVLQFPHAENAQTAVVQVQVVTQTGCFSATGDASPESVSPKMVPHLIRLAETRALARALRWANNIALTALEELGYEAPVSHSEPESNDPKLPQRPITKAQCQAVQRLARYLGWSEQNLSHEVYARFETALNALDRSQASLLIQELQQQRQGVAA